ncbi:MFS transporter [Sulfobacillus sp. hq2]|uniref:MFS transporter n=1 Tax=Sulfobacillus TaxID=28033 RepID=UPI000CD22088|nr:MFS transporter [Sulfobacillus sp. hq2]POB11667.1 MFS transporter [Sulfobacillus sp. hq2]
MDASLMERDNMPIDRSHVRVTVLTVAGYFLDGFDLLVISVALLTIVPAFHPTAVATGLIGSATIAGMFFGGLGAGFLVDRLGRRRIYLWDLIVFIIFTIGAAVAQNIWQLILFRGLLGVGIGADYALTLTIVSEFAPIKGRGTLMGAGLLAYWIGAVASIFLGLLFFLIAGGLAWRLTLLVGVIPAIIVLILRHTVPESPRWKAVTEGNKIGASQISLKSLMRPPFARRVWLSYANWFINDIIFYGIGIYTPILLLGMGLKTHIASIAGSGILDVMGMFGAFAGMILLDRWGRRPLQVWGFLLQGATLLVFAFNPKPSLLLLSIAFAVFYIANAGGTGQTTGIFVSELVPTRVRGTAMGLGTAISRIGAFVSAFLLPVILKAEGIEVILVLTGLCALIGVALTLGLPETRYQSLENLNENIANAH